MQLTRITRVLLIAIAALVVLGSPSEAQTCGSDQIEDGGQSLNDIYNFEGFYRLGMGCTDSPYYAVLSSICGQWDRTVYVYSLSRTEVERAVEEYRARGEVGAGCELVHVSGIGVACFLALPGAPNCSQSQGEATGGVSLGRSNVPVGRQGGTGFSTAGNPATIGAPGRNEAVETGDFTDLFIALERDSKLAPNEPVETGDLTDLLTELEGNANLSTEERETGAIDPSADFSMCPELTDFRYNTLDPERTRKEAEAKRLRDDTESLERFRVQLKQDTTSYLGLDMGGATQGVTATAVGIYKTTLDLVLNLLSQVGPEEVQDPAARVKAVSDASWCIADGIRAQDASPTIECFEMEITQTAIEFSLGHFRQTLGTFYDLLVDVGDLMLDMEQWEETKSVIRSQTDALDRAMATAVDEIARLKPDIVELESIDKEIELYCRANPGR